MSVLFVSLFDVFSEGFFFPYFWVPVFHAEVGGVVTPVAALFDSDPGLLIYTKH